MAPNVAVISGTTYAIGSGASPITKVIAGQTVSFGRNGVGFASTTVPAPEWASSSQSAVTAGGLTFSVDSTAAIISGTTYAIGSGASPITKVIAGQTVSFGRNGVGFASTTVPAPEWASSSQSAVTAGGLTFSVDSTAAVISGTTYSIGKDASPTTKLWTWWDRLPSTSVPVPEGASSLPSAVTAHGLTFSVDSTAAIISGTTYAIGSGASPTTKVVGGQTVSFGPNGVGLASTTIPVPTASSTGAASPALELYTGSASDSGIAGAAIGTILAFGVCFLFLL
ncbi:MAG: hypothetical protein M1830_009139 [Pleopsidium flavum]|nr:MAG: hypothetical protein M1830_009139 [Pleopsidium flavum]